MPTATVPSLAAFYAAMDSFRASGLSDKALDRAMCDWAEDNAPEALDWAENIRSDHTTYSRRTYGGVGGERVTYCYADVDLVYVADDRAWLCDPYPANTFPRATLLVLLMSAYLNEGRPLRVC